jgi:hypothetical protein
MITEKYRQPNCLFIMWYEIITEFYFDMCNGNMTAEKSSKIIEPLMKNEK